MQLTESTCFGSKRESWLLNGRMGHTRILYNSNWKENMNINKTKE